MNDSAFDLSLWIFAVVQHARFRSAISGGAVGEAGRSAGGRVGAAFAVTARGHPARTTRVILKATNRAAMVVLVPALFVRTVEGLTFGGSNGGEQRVEWPRQGIPADCRVDEQPCVAQVAARAAPHESVYLRFGLPAAPGGLALERAERSEVALRASRRS